MKLKKEQYSNDKEYNNKTIRDNNLVQEQGKNPLGGNPFKYSSLVDHHKNISVEGTMSPIHMIEVDNIKLDLQIYNSV